MRTTTTTLLHAQGMTTFFDEEKGRELVNDISFFCTARKLRLSLFPYPIMRVGWPAGGGDCFASKIYALALSNLGNSEAEGEKRKETIRNYPFRPWRKKYSLALVLFRVTEWESGDKKCLPLSISRSNCRPKCFFLRRETPRG